MTVDFSPQARFVFAALHDAGFECYLVGGWVRDRLLGRPDDDLDFTTNARPEELLAVFAGSHYPNRFGTVIVPLDGEQIEITTYRGEGRYSDHRHPDQIAFVDRLEDDLGRRDFTINAMAMDASGRIVDPFGGRADLARRLIRAVGDPEARLAEDPLRMMRAVRLAAQLDLRIEGGTRRGIARQARLLRLISGERIRDELLKILDSRRSLWGFDLLVGLDLLSTVLPAVAALPPEAGLHARHTLRWARGNALLRLAALLHVLDEQDAGHIDSTAGARPPSTSSPMPRLRADLARLRLSGAEQERVTRLIEALPLLPADLAARPVEARRLLSRLGTLLPDALRLARAHRQAIDPEGTNVAQLRAIERYAERARRAGVPLTLGDLAIGGDDLQIELGIPPGPPIGRLLRLLLDRVLDDPALNERGTLIEIARAARADPYADRPRRT